MKKPSKLLAFLAPKATNEPRTTDYEGFSDFLLHAPLEKKIEVFTEAAKLANEDQRRLLERAGAL